MEKIKDFMNTNAANMVAWGALAAMAGLTLLQLISILGSLSQLPQVFTNLAHYLGFGHAPKPGSGVIYDAESGQPISFADIKVVGKDGVELESGTTGKNGFYEFKRKEDVDVKIMASRKGYRMMTEDELNALPTAYNPTFTADSEINFGKGQMIQPGLPLKKDGRAGLGDVLKKIKLNTIMDALFWGGLAYNLAFSLSNPSPVNYAIGGSYLATGLIKFANVAKPTWGGVKSLTGGPSAHTVVKALNTKSGEMFGRAVTSGKGKYSFILGKGEYDLVAETLNGKGIKHIIVKSSKIVNDNILIKPTK